MWNLIREIFKLSAATESLYAISTNTLHNQLKEATIKMIRVLSGDKNVDDTEEILKGLDIAEEDEISMCELFDQYTRRGREEGMKGMIITCKEFNINYDDTMSKLRKNLNITESEAKEVMKKFW